MKGVQDEKTEKVYGCKEACVITARVSSEEVIAIQNV